MPTLYDFRGRPVRAADLQREVARPAKTGSRAWAFTSVARGMTPERLAAVFAKADKGDLRDLLTLASEIEERDAHAGAQLRTRKLALAALPWVVEAASDDARDVQIAEEIQAIVDSHLWKPAIVNAMDAVNKPFAALELIWKPGPKWTLDAIEWRDPRHFTIDDEDGSTLRLRTDDGSVELAPWKWIIHSPVQTSGPLAKRGLCRPLAITYAIKTLGASAWLSFVELFGIPARIGKYPVGAPEHEIDALEDAVKSLGADAAGVMPASMQIEILDAIGKGATGDAHGKLVAWVEAQQSKAILGQTMTADDGSSLAQAQIHQLVRRDILEADIGALEATLVRDLVRPYVDINYGPPAKGYPKLRCSAEEPEDLKAFTEAALPWVKAGVDVEKSVIRDKFGWPEPAEGAEVVGGSSSSASASAGAAGAGAAGAATPAAPADAAAPVDAQAAAAARRQRLAAEDDGDDFIDRDLQPDDWRETMAPVRDAVLEAARSSDSFTGFLAKLEAASADGDAFVKSLARRTMIARGVGDATDDVEL